MGGERSCKKWRMLMTMILVLRWSCCGVDAVRRASTLNLASMRIYTAELQLKESGGRAATVLAEHCRSEVESVQEGLQTASKRIAVDPDKARQELVRVGDLLQLCSQNLLRSSPVVNSQAHDLVTRVEQSVASAENLIDHSEIAEIEPPSMHETPSEDISEVEMPAEDAWVPLLESRVGSRPASRIPVPPKINIVMSTDLVVDFCPNHVELTDVSATIRLDRACGGKFHTRARYSSGVFSIRMRAPSSASGVSNSFYISSNGGSPDVISFDFVGNEPQRVLTAYAVNGNHDQKLKTFQMGFDTTAEFHEYTIKWDEESIVWMVDDVVIRTLRASRVAPNYPSKPGHVYGYSWDASAVADGAMAGKVNWYNAPYFMSFGSFQVASPLRARQWHAPRQLELSTTGPVRPLVIEYSPNNIATDPGDHGYDITFDKFGCGSRIRSLHAYASGRFSARIKCAEGDTSGLLTSFYLSSGEGSIAQDEIDFEFLGDNKQMVQTNFYVNGTSANEQWVELQYDCSSGFHTYAIHFDERQIQWFVDSRLVRTVVKQEQPESAAGFPVKKMFLYSSVWNASDVNDGGWTGKWHGMAELPFVARFKDVTASHWCR